MGLCNGQGGPNTFGGYDYDDFGISAAIYMRGSRKTKLKACPKCKDKGLVTLWRLEDPYKPWEVLCWRCFRTTYHHELVLDAETDWNADRVAEEGIDYDRG